MKTKLIVFTTITLLLLIGGSGCEKEIFYPDATLIKDLPKMYLTGNIKQGEQEIIRTKEELLTFFSQFEIDKVNELKNIDFTNQTLLIGCDNYSNEVNNLRYTFSKKNEKEYILHVEISGGATRPEGIFYYGIIAKKLPETAIVTFEIIKL